MSSVYAQKCFSRHFSHHFLQSCLGHDPLQTATGVRGYIKLYGSLGSWLLCQLALAVMCGSRHRPIVHPNFCVTAIIQGFHNEASLLEDTDSSESQRENKNGEWYWSLQWERAVLWMDLRETLGVGHALIWIGKCSCRKATIPAGMALGVLIQRGQKARKKLGG